MPGSSRVELFRELKLIQPGLPVIFMSAYSPSDLVQQGLHEHAFAILTKPSGIGLGLPISKMLIEANHGMMEVESKEGEGTTFRLTLPTPGARPKGGM
jgi:DNA-binding NtrC family response regulator